ncbi:hypothetical protein I552_9946 [Mycobacterium xenopi 3993]|nr:hypothetical protein I552_9946 [Mycobacterium xenopi 3993]
MVITPRWCSRWWYGQTSTRLANSVAPPSSQWTMWWACSPRVAHSREPRTWGGGARGRGAAAGRRPGWRARAEGLPVALKPHFAGGITGQIFPVGLR